MLNALRKYLENRETDRLAKRFGGVQKCPWCKQWAQKDANPDWKFTPCEEDLQLDTLTCGVCGGTSHWLWAMGFIYIRPGKPPLPGFSSAVIGQPDSPRLAAEGDQPSSISNPIQGEKTV